MYKKNENSIGVVLLNINTCASSELAKTSFRRLHEALEKHVGHALPIHPHTHGQFQALQDHIEDYNKSLEKSLHIPFSFSDDIYKETLFHEKKGEILKTFEDYKIKVPKNKEQEFEELVMLTSQLKVCPGDKYEVFLNLIKK